MDDRTDYLVEQLTARLAAVQAAEAGLAAAVQRIPRSVPLNVFENWRSTVGFTLGPVLLVRLTLLLSGHFSRVPKEDIAKVQAELAQAQGAVQRFQECRATLAKERPELAYQYFPYPNDPQPAKASYSETQADFRLASCYEKTFLVRVLSSLKWQRPGGPLPLG